MFYVHIYPNLAKDLGLSVCQSIILVGEIIEQSGINSGLVLQIKDNISATNWRSAKLMLRKSSPPGWYEVTKVSW